MQDKPLVSVIMNCFNGEKYLHEAINSVCTQTHENWEIILWDNASSEDIQSLLIGYDKRLRFFMATSLFSKRIFVFSLQTLAWLILSLNGYL